MKNFFILVIIIIILFVIFKCSKNIMENFNDNPRILIWLLVQIILIIIVDGI